MTPGVRELHPVDRPRERMASKGAGALSEEELLALLLRTGYAGCGVLELASDLLRRYPKGALARLPMRELGRIRGVGPSRAAALGAAFELARRWEVSGPGEGAPLLDTPSRVMERLSFLKDKRKEHFVALYLNACNRLLHEETVSIGTLTASLVHPREVFSPAVERGAASVIVAHNHPSGDLRPSPEDRETTRRLVGAGRLLGIPLLDHLLVAGSGYLSFREKGLLEGS